MRCGESFTSSVTPITALPSLAWSHRKIPPLHQLEREESRLVIRGNPQNRICKKIALQRPKTGKFDYLSEPNHPAHSMAFKFFTDDYLRFEPRARIAPNRAPALSRRIEAM